MTGLLAAENIAGSAKLEIERRETKSGAEIGEFAYSAQTAAGDRRQLQFARNQQISVSPPI